MLIRAMIVVAIAWLCVPSVAAFAQSGGMPETSHAYWGFGGGGGLVHSITDASDPSESESPKIRSRGVRIGRLRLWEHSHGRRVRHPNLWQQHTTLTMKWNPFCQPSKLFMFSL